LQIVGARTNAATVAATALRDRCCRTTSAPQIVELWRVSRLQSLDRRWIMPGGKGKLSLAFWPPNAQSPVIVDGLLSTTYVDVTPG
jgi:hypothetical protein